MKRDAKTTMGQAMRKTFVAAALVRPAVALFLGGAALAADGKIALKVGRVITQAGAEVENGYVVIDGGKISAVGAGVAPPWDAEVIDRPDLVAFPGFVEAHTSRGMDRPNENVDVAPFLDVRDSIDPISFYFEDMLRAGITTINVQQGPQTVVGGQGMVVKPFGMTVEQMSARNASGVKISLVPRPGRSRATQAQAVRRAFTDLRLHLEKLVKDKKDGKDTARREALFQGRDLDKEENKKGRAMTGNATWKVADLEIVPRGEIDEKQEPLLRVVEGRLPVFFQVSDAAGVHLALEIARSNGFLATTTLVVDGDAWKAADVVAEAGVPVVLGANLLHVERDPVTGKEIETFVPKKFAEKGVRFALQSLNPPAQALWFQAAMCVGHGLDRQAALDAVTRVPAEILRLGDRVGSLEPGKDGNVVLLSGDPLSVRSRVEYVVIEGRVVYDRSKDVRMRHLIEGVEQPNAGQAGVEAASDPHGGHGDDHKDPVDDEKKKTDKGETPPKDDGEDEKRGDDRR